MRYGCNPLNFIATARTRERRQTHSTEPHSTAAQSCYHIPSAETSELASAISAAASTQNEYGTASSHLSWHLSLTGTSIPPRRAKHAHVSRYRKDSLRALCGSKSWPTEYLWACYCPFKSRYVLVGKLSEETTRVR